MYRYVRFLLIFAVTALAVVSCIEEDPEPLKPVAEFTSAAEDLTVTFTNSSKNATSYAWDFGDENTSTGENPTHTFSKAGTYTVKLTATGEGGSGEMTKEVTVEAPEEPEKPLPAAGFTFEAEDLRVAFTNASENATSYVWDFGDDNTSTEESPIHTYAEAGTYTVKLTATGEGGTDVETKELTVEAPVPAPIADFTFTVENLEVAFTNASENATSYAWDFGDGNTSTEENPTHIFAEAGTYTVALTATGEDGTEVSASKEVIVEASVVPERVYFDVADQPELRTIPSFRTPGSAPVAVDAEQLAGVTTEGLTTFSYQTVPVGDGHPRAFYDFLALPMRIARINKITFTTPTIIRGQYKVWACFRRTGEDGQLLVEFNGEPLQNPLPYAEFFPHGDEAKLLALGLKRYTTPNTGQSQCRLVGTIDVATTSTHEISLKVLVDDHRGDVWLDMIQFIPVEEDQLWPKVAEDGTLVYSAE